MQVNAFYRELSLERFDNLSNNEQREERILDRVYHPLPFHGNIFFNPTINEMPIPFPRSALTSTIPDRR